MRRLAWIGAVLLFTACSSSHSPLPDVSLKSLDGASSPSLASCPTPKCLTAYMAPWCPHCREAAPYVKGLKDYLAKNNVSLRIIIGQDNPDNLLAYAKYFGPDTLIDADGVVHTNGVPQFFVTDSRGRLLKQQSGFPPNYHGGLIQLAGMLDLP